MKNDLKLRTKTFAHNCVKLTETLPNSYLGTHIKGQLIRSATSTAANYRAACVAQSKPSFVAKLSIAFEEVDESGFWLEFIKDEKLIIEKAVEPLFKEANELAAIFASSRKTARAK